MTTSIFKRTRVAADCAVLALLVPSPARSEPLRFGPHDFTSLFFISKSEKRNQVEYGIHLDDQCAPIGDALVFEF